MTAVVSFLAGVVVGATGVYLGLAYYFGSRP